MAIPYEKLAEELYGAHKNACQVDPVSGRFPEFTLADALKVQKLNIARRVSEGHRLIGKKIGYTNAQIQARFGVSEPVYGHLVSDCVKSQYERIDRKTMMSPFIEVEVCFVMGKRLVGPNILPFDVLRAAAGVFASIEIPDSRQNGNFPKTAADAVADNVGNAYIVLGDRLTPVTGLDLQSEGMVLEKNHKIVASSSGAAVLGNPLYSVTWLVNKLAETGDALEEGDIVMSGSLTPVIPELFVSEGDVFEARFATLGRVRAMF